MAHDLLKRDLEQEGLYAAFSRLIGETANLANAVVSVERSLGRAVINRNRHLHELARSAPDVKQKILAAALEGASLDDDALSAEMQELGHGMQNKWAEMEALSEIVTEILGKSNDLMCEALDQKGQLKAELDQLQQRLKEHALHNTEIREAVWCITGGKCFYCDVWLVRSAEGEDRSRLFHIDHLVPKAHGGPDHLHNYVPACERCNIQKNSKSYVEFLAWRKAQAQPPALTLIDGGAA